MYFIGYCCCIVLRIVKVRKLSQSVAKNCHKKERFFAKKQKGQKGQEGKRGLFCISGLESGLCELLSHSSVSQKV
ncbi:MAG: hypothetical protein IKU97_05085, partial [Tidjanibacter sp.]|nr:hypothetical protein [Tidjanibacter sp.]